MIPATILSEALGFNPFDTSQPTLAVPQAVFSFLLQSYLAQLPFDEAAYLNANPDVAQAVQDGEFASGLSHFLQIGYQEERGGFGSDFQEDWYLQQNTDVAVAVRLGDWPSGQAHYQAHGKQEGRCPSPTVRAVYEQWQALLNQRPSPKTSK